jgi:ADP-heptose:LPS heptosyltransferase
MDHENIGSNVPVRVMAGNITDGTFVDQVTEDYPIVVRIWDKGNPKRLTDDVYYQVDHPYVKGQRTNLNHAAQTVLVHMYKKHYENHKVISEKNYDKLIKHLESLGWKVIIAETLHHTQLTEIHQQNILDTTIHPSPGLEFDAYDPFVMTQSNRPPSYWNKLIKDQLESCTFVLASEGGISHLARLMGVPQLVWYQKGNAPSYIEHMNWNGDTYQQIDGRSVDNIDTFQAKMDHVLDHAYG